MKGSVYQKGNSWIASFSNGTDKNGKRKRYTFSFKTKRQAEMKLLELNNDFYNGKLTSDDEMLLSDFLKYWFNCYVKINLAENTVNGYRTNIFRHIIPALGNIKVRDIKPITIQNFYVDLLNSGLSPTTITYIHRNLYTAFKYASKMQLFYNNTFEYVTPPKRKKYDPIILSVNEATKLLEVSKRTEIYLPVALALTLGIRRGEALGLQWTDFDCCNSTLKIVRNGNRVKGGMEFAPLKTHSSQRCILLPNEVVSILLSEKARQNECRGQLGNIYNPNNLICCRADGEWITTNYLDKHFKKLLTDNDLPPIRFHDLRHFNATMMIENNVPIKVVSARLGHASSDITLDTYTHVTHAMQEGCADVLSRKLFAN